MDCISRPLSPPIAFPTTLFKPPPIAAARLLFLSRSTSLKLSISSARKNPNSFNGGGGGGGGGGDNSDSNSNSDNYGDNNSNKHLSLFLICSSIQLAASASAVASNDDEFMLFLVKGGNKIKLIPDYFKDVFVIPDTRFSTSLSIGNVWLQLRSLFMRLMLPEGFPISVTSDYLEYSLWRSVQGVAAQVSGVLATQVYIIIITPQPTFSICFFSFDFECFCN